MPLVRIGYLPLDRPHRELHRCLREVAVAVRSRDAEAVRGRYCLLAETLAEHFGEEEALMRARGWSGLAHHVDCHRALLARVRLLERHVADAGVTHELAAWSLARLPEMLRFHEIAADFGFGMFARGKAGDPGRRLARRAVRG
jgi:hemerythrin-like metal-binding protein